MSCPIFISYSRKDLDLVSKLVNEIESEYGVKCWIDLTGIESGDKFENKIIAAIDNAEVILFMLSDNSMESEYAKMEINYAKNRNKKLIPVIIDHGELRGWFLFKFGGLDYIDIFNDIQKQKLFNNLKKWAGNDAVQTVTPAQSVQQNTVTQSQQTNVIYVTEKERKSKVMPIICIVLALIIAIGVYMFIFNKNPETAEQDNTEMVTDSSASTITEDNTVTTNAANTEESRLASTIKNGDPSTWYEANIQDPDGYVNIRQDKNANSMIVGQVKEGNVFYVHWTQGNWWPIYYQINGKVIGYLYNNRINIQRTISREEVKRNSPK